MRPCRLLVLAALISILPTIAFSRTWHITADGLGDAPTIQAGIDSSAAGDSILVGQGTYFENLVMQPERTLSGSWNAAFTQSDVHLHATTVDGDSTTSVLMADYGSLQDAIGKIDGLRIVGGNGLVEGGIRRGGGIFARGLQEFSNCIVAGNGADEGGGMYVRSDNITLRGVSILGNLYTGRGGGASLIAEESTFIEDSLIGGNAPEIFPSDDIRGAGLYVEGVTCRIEQSQVGGNGSDFFNQSSGGVALGAGIFSACSVLSLVASDVGGNRFESSEHVAGSGIYADSLFASGSSVLENRVYSYSSAANGGGIYARACHLVDCIVAKNTSNGGKWIGSGGGVFAQESVSMERCLVDDNFCFGIHGAFGGGVRATSVVAANSRICRNRVANVDAKGGGIYANYVEGVNLTLDSNVTTDWIEGEGQAIWVGTQGEARLRSSIVTRHIPEEWDGTDVGVLFGNVISSHNLFFGNTIDLFAGGSADSSDHLHADPLFAPPDTSDFHLLLHSPAIDRGDPAVLDPDGSRSDMGAHGGPGAIMSQPSRVTGAQRLTLWLRRRSRLDRSWRSRSLRLRGLPRADCRCASGALDSSRSSARHRSVVSRSLRIPGLDVLLPRLGLR